MWLTSPTVRLCAQGVENVQYLKRVFVEAAEAFVDEEGIQGAAAGFVGDDIGEATGQGEKRRRIRLRRGLRRSGAPIQASVICRPSPERRDPPCLRSV